MANVATGKKANIFQRMSKFVKEAIVELKKTSWPDADELKKSTILVLVAVAIITLWIGGLDTFFGLITRRFVGW